MGLGVVVTAAEELAVDEGLPDTDDVAEGVGQDAESHAVYGGADVVHSVVVLNGASVLTQALDNNLQAHLDAATDAQVSHVANSVQSTNSCM